MEKIITEFLKRDKEKKLEVAVFGDSMIDQYFYTEVSRISPEYPIPVSLSLSEKPDHILPGGAANTVFQFSFFNVNAHLVSFINQKAKTIYDQCGVDTEYCQLCEYQIPIKKRFYHGDFPLSRWDIEEPNKCPNNFPFAEIKDNLMKMDMFIFSDYNKGFFKDYSFRPFIEQTTIPTIVDPKREDIEKWKGCTVFKPNAVEAKRLSGRNNWEEQAKYFQEFLGCKAVMITMGGEGVGGVVNEKIFKYKPKKKAINVNSCIGAGDAYCCFTAMALGRGFTIEEAVEIAYEAGAIYVQNKHNEPVTRHLLLAQEDPIAAKFRQPNELCKRDYKLAFTNGCWDIMHAGYLSTLQFAKSKADKLVVAVNSDESVTRLKGPSRPINALQNRMRMLAALEMVDFVVSFEEDTPRQIIEAIRPDVLVKSGYKLEDIVGHDIVPEVYAVPMVEGLSTSNIIKRL